MIKAIRYKPENKKQWDEFISNSKNSVFSFYRDYMEYHSDRFVDFSLLFMDDNKIIAAMPANIREDVLISHEGLTFAGVISYFKMRTPVMMNVFTEMKKILKAEGVKKVIYKAIPYIYHVYPAEEDLYALFRNNAKLIQRDVTTTISLPNNNRPNELRRRTLKKAQSQMLRVMQSNDYEVFMTALKKILCEKYNTKPTHTTEEITLLADRFPKNIKLFGCYKDDEMLAGVIIYESRNVAHAQYIAASQKGKQLGATDLIFDFLLNTYNSRKRYFDFGISTENSGKYLNEGLIRYKESFSGHAVTQDIYEMLIN